MLSGCTAAETPNFFGVVMYEPSIQTLTYQIKGHPVPNVEFCAVEDKDLIETYMGLSVTKDGSIVYAFNRLKLTEHPDTWVKLLRQKDASNRWPHTYTFDINGDGGADVFFMDEKRDGKCNLVEIGQGKSA
jgi:hypothetical protein